MRKSRKPAEIHETILRIIFSNETPLTPHEIAKETGYDVRTVKNHLQIAAVSELVTIIASKSQAVALVYAKQIPEKFRKDKYGEKK